MELAHDRKAEVAASCCLWLEQHQHADLRAAATTSDVTFPLQHAPAPYTQRHLQKLEIEGSIRGEDCGIQTT